MTYADFYADKWWFGSRMLTDTTVGVQSIVWHDDTDRLRRAVHAYCEVDPKWFRDYL